MQLSRREATRRVAREERQRPRPLIGQGYRMPLVLEIF